jgi:general secretion pathway protein A
MYEQVYGFTERPFQLTPDARYWYESRTHKKAMAYLGYGLAQGEGFIVITGEIGAGKSTLVAHLMATIDRERLNAISLVSTQVEGDDMLRLAALGLGLETGGVMKAQLLDRIEQRLREEASKGKRTLLIVDEVQNLPVSSLEELRMLSNFTSQGRALIQIFLLGQPEFRDRVAADDSLEQLRQRVIATHHLEPMDANEVEPYVVHRLAVAGWEGRPSFEPDSFAALYRHAGGVPRKLNQLASRLFLYAGVEQLEAISGADVDAVAADMAADRPASASRRVLPLRRPAAAPEFAPDASLEGRIAAIEARLDEQEAAVRRVLTVLLDWVENESQPRRSNAA